MSLALGSIWVKKEKDIKLLLIFLLHILQLRRTRVYFSISWCFNHVNMNEDSKRGGQRLPGISGATHTVAAVSLTQICVSIFGIPFISLNLLFTRNKKKSFSISSESSSIRLRQHTVSTPHSCHQISTFRGLTAIISKHSLEKKKTMLWRHHSVGLFVQKY